MKLTRNWEESVECSKKYDCDMEEKEEADNREEEEEEEEEQKEKKEEEEALNGAYLESTAEMCGFAHWTFRDLVDDIIKDHHILEARNYNHFLSHIFSEYFKKVDVARQSIAVYFFT